MRAVFTTYSGRDVENHQEALKAFCKKYRWQGKFHGGHINNGMV